jgi:hypothetical protein
VRRCGNGRIDAGKGIQLESLRRFLVVAEELHFTRAADRLFVSQPALSKQIGMLERQLGARLFERGRDGVRLTPMGTALLPHARLVLAEWDRAWAAAEQAKASQRAALDGRGVCLLAAGNAPLIVREGVVARPVRGISPSRLALAWRATAARSYWTTYARAGRSPRSFSRTAGCARPGHARKLAPVLRRLRRPSIW